MAAVTVIDYGGGNIASVVNALDRLGVAAVVTGNPEDVVRAERIILPGVGAAGLALRGLRSRHLDVALDEAVRTRATPFLGICVGMQVMARTLHEFGEHRGLGWIAGEVRHLRDIASPLRVPNMGWVAVDHTAEGADLFQGVRGNRQFYFCHSYAFDVEEAACIGAYADAGGRFVAAVRSGTAWGVQFHPEKSQLNGEHLLSAFLEWAP